MSVPKWDGAQQRMNGYIYCMDQPPSGVPRRNTLYTRMYTTRKNEYVQFHFRNNLRMFRFKPKQFSLYFDRSFLDGSLQKSSNEFSESVLLNGLPTPGTILKQLKTGPFERNPNSITRV